LKPGGQEGKAMKALAIGVVLAMVAAPLAVQAAQPAQTPQEGPAKPSPKPPVAHPVLPDRMKRQGGTLRTTARAGGPASSQRASTDAADDATAAMARLNSSAATSGQINSRNALSPATAAVGPAGTPVAGGGAR
jgi:hypothetical protein